VWKYWRRVTRQHLRFVPNRKVSRWVGYGSVPPDGGQAMHVCSHWFVTNMSTENNIRIVAARFSRRLPRTRWWKLSQIQETEAMSIYFVDQRHRVLGDALPAHHHAELDVMFFVREPLPTGETLRGLTTFVDNFGHVTSVRTAYPFSVIPLWEHRR
jgi:hypothetical protein